MKTYFGTWSANNGSTYLREPIKDTNLQRLEKRLRQSCKGNIFCNSSGNYTIYESRDFELVPIIQGMIYKKRNVKFIYSKIRNRI